MAKNSNNVLALGVGLNLDPLNQDIANAAKTAKEGMNVVAQSVVDAENKSDKPLRETKDKLISLSAQLRQARLDAQQLSQGGKELGEAFQASVSKAASLKDQIAAVDNAIINNSTTIQNQGQPAFSAAKNGYNGMAMSINQLTREMPAFTYSMQTGFMAISNNIPMFVDQINIAKKANMELMASGQPVESVFSQIASSLFSFQTLMGVGITILTVFGAEIYKFAASLFTANDEVEKINKSMRSQIIIIETLRGLTKDYLDLYERGLTGKDLALAQQRNKHQEDLNKIIENTIKLQKEEEITGEKNIIGRNIIYFSMIASAKRNKEAIDKINKDFNKKELEELEKANKEKQSKQDAYSKNLVDLNKWQTQQIAMANKMADEKAKLAPKLARMQNSLLPRLGASGYDFGAGKKLNVQLEFSFDSINLAAEMDQASKKLAEATKKMWEGLKNITDQGIANTFGSVGQSIGDSLAASLSNEDADMMDAIGVAIVKSLGQMAVQVGSMLIALSVPMMLAGLPTGFAYAAAGTGLIALGSMVSGLAGRKSQGGTTSAATVTTPTSNFNGNGSNYIGGNNSGNIVINGMIKGNDIQLVNGRNDRKFNRSLRFG